MKRFKAISDEQGGFVIYDANKNAIVVYEFGALKGRPVRYDTKGAADDETWHLNQLAKEKED